MDVLRNMARERNQEIKQYSSLYRLDLLLHDDGLIRVAGRIKRANFQACITHPIIMPRRSHMGRGVTFNELRQRGYWTTGGTPAVSNLIAKYVSCKRFRGFLQTQKMSDLPKDRLALLPPFLIVR